jgi:hypothetical protein
LEHHAVLVTGACLADSALLYSVPRKLGFEEAKYMEKYGK